ncbi:MAG: T9SS type A sorting domain-containing protein [Bacteroidota bacterium]
MKSIKIKPIFIVLFLTISFNAQSQIYKTGDIFPTYIDINPDTLLNYHCSSGPSSIVDYYFNMNGGSQYDLKITAYCEIGLASQYRNISISCLNPDFYIRFGRYDSVYNNNQSGWWVTEVAKPLQYGDTINSMFSIWSNSYLYLTDWSQETGNSKSIVDWVSIIDEYIGIKYQNATDTIYGWIRVNCSSTDSLYIKDYSFGALTPNIQSFELVNFNIYPNPTPDNLNIETNSNTEQRLEITNLIGQTVYTSYIYRKGIINTSSFAKGVYILKLSSDKETIVRKFIKE